MGVRKEANGVFAPPWNRQKRNVSIKKNIILFQVLPFLRKNSAGAHDPSVSQYRTGAHMTKYYQTVSSIIASQFILLLIFRKNW